QEPGVAALSSALGVERRPIEERLTLLPRPQLLHEGVAADNRQHARLLDRRPRIADELDRPYRQARGDRRRGGDRLLHAPARAFALLRHRPLEAGLIDAEAPAVRDVPDQVERDAEGVVQAERLGTGSEA